MIRLRGGRVVLPDRLVDDGAVLVEGDRIAEVGEAGLAGAHDIDCRGCWILPAFIDVHVHGVQGADVLGDDDGVAAVAAALPRFGVAGFCPTSMACTPDALTRFLSAIGAARHRPAANAARVLGAHLESNFINPDYKGAQPVACLRVPPRPGDSDLRDGEFTGAAITRVIAAHRDAVRIITLAPELDGALPLVTELVAAGHRVSLGHSGASFEVGGAAIALGARHATHLYNRMPPLSHREPGLAGAVLVHDEVTAEIICDGVHVHPAMVRATVRAKGLAGVVAISDGTAGSGLPVGSAAHLGSMPIRVTGRGARFADDTLAGSVTTMDAIFRRLLRDVRLAPIEAARLCATSPALALGLAETGAIRPGALADLVVLDDAFQVRQTWIGGALAWNSGLPGAVSHREEQG